MPESPLATLARILAGVALVQGRLGHQVLGQLLIANTNDAAIAAAAVVVAGTSRTRNAVAQVALRTAAPAIAVHTILRREEQRLTRLDDLVRARQANLEKEARALEEERTQLRARLAAVAAPTSAAPGAPPAATAAASPAVTPTASVRRRRAATPKPPAKPAKKPRKKPER